MINEQEIQNYLARKGIEYKPNASIVAITMPSTGMFLLVGALSTIATRYYAINFTDTGLAVIGIKSLKGGLDEEDFFFIPRADLQGVQIKKKMTRYKMTINATQATIKYQVNKKIYGAAWHQENLSNVLALTNNL